MPPNKKFNVKTHEVKTLQYAYHTKEIRNHIAENIIQEGCHLCKQFYFNKLGKTNELWINEISQNDWVGLQLKIIFGGLPHVWVI